MLHLRSYNPDSFSPMPVQCSQGIAQTRLECAANLITGQAPTPFADRSWRKDSPRTVLGFRAGLAEHTRLNRPVQGSLDRSTYTSCSSTEQNSSGTHRRKQATVLRLLCSSDNHFAVQLREETLVCGRVFPQSRSQCGNQRSASSN